MANLSRTKRKRFNLIRTIGKRNMTTGLVWFIGKWKNGKTFYIADYDDDNNVVMWSRNKKDGLSFKTEAGIQKFISKHLHDRKDIMLIHSSPN